MFKCPKMKRCSGGGIRRTKKERTVLLPELVTEILLRLPVKSLVRFKSVCKSWHFLISDPHFAKSHFELAVAPRTERLVLVTLDFSSEPSAPKFRSIDFNESLYDDYASTTLTNMFHDPKPRDDVQILGSCRGFLLLELNCVLYVWNPSTGAHKFIDSPPIVSSLKGKGPKLGIIVHILFRGFGYDPSTDDYLVVQVSSKPSFNDYVTCVQFFSLRANAWKEIEATHLSYRQCSFYLDSVTGCFFNDAIHWLAFRDDVSIHVIVAFDLTERSFSDIPLPVDFEYGKFKVCVLRVLGELLNLCAVGHNAVTEIWVIKEYKVQSSWTKTIVMAVDDFPFLSFFPICSTKNGDIVGTNARAGLMKYNDKGQLQEYWLYCDGPCGSRVAVYTESLLSLPCDGQQAGEDD